MLPSSRATFSIRAAPIVALARTARGGMSATSIAFISAETEAAWKIAGVGAHHDSWTGTATCAYRVGLTPVIAFFPHQALLRVVVYQLLA
jgi:hypothetical protein